MGFWGFPGHTSTLQHRHLHLPVSCSQKQTEVQKQRVRYQLEKLHRFLEQQEQLFVAWLEELGQTIGKGRETYDTQVSRDIAFLNKLIEELEAKQCQPEWELLQVSMTGPGLDWYTVPSRMTWTPSTDISSVQVLVAKGGTWSW